mmetsp:Transcript_112668/g.318320  ORF Transcript_112668/g.318320 Transcript_112668/m.318320 type:complete len:263 (+) Transcript_112668:963-1751(+)
MPTKMLAMTSPDLRQRSHVQRTVETTPESNGKPNPKSTTSRVLREVPPAWKDTKSVTSAGVSSGKPIVRAARASKAEWALRNASRPFKMNEMATARHNDGMPATASATVRLARACATNCPRDLPDQVINNGLLLDASPCTASACDTAERKRSCRIHGGASNLPTPVKSWSLRARSLSTTPPWTPDTPASPHSKFPSFPQQSMPTAQNSTRPVLFSSTMGATQNLWMPTSRFVMPKAFVSSIVVLPAKRTTAASAYAMAGCAG